MPAYGRGVEAGTTTITATGCRRREVTVAGCRSPALFQLGAEVLNPLVIGGVPCGLIRVPLDCLA